MNTPSKKFFVVVQLVSNFFLGVDSEKSHEYTFEKNSLQSFGYFKIFLECILNDFQQPRVE